MTYPSPSAPQPRSDGSAPLRLDDLILSDGHAFDRKTGNRINIQPQPERLMTLA